MRARVTSRQVRRITDGDPNARIPIAARMRKVEERLDETQAQVISLVKGQERAADSLLRIATRQDEMSGRTDRQFDELRSLMSQLLSRAAQSIATAEQAFHWRCSDCPQRPKRPDIEAGPIE